MGTVSAGYVDISVVNRFVALLKSGKLAHAYLLIGPLHSGKSETALRIAAMAVCPHCLETAGEEAESSCSAAVRIRSGNHPDVRVVELGEGQVIGIDQIKDAVAQMQLRPFEAARKVCVIREVERLSAEAGNALLKTLEEPTLHSLFLLTTAVPERNLGTIRSRCHAVHFPSWPKEKLASRLKNDYAINDDAVRFLTLFSEGCWGRAKALQESRLFERKNEILDRFLGDRDAESFIKTVLPDKDKTKEVLDVLLSFFRDVLLVKSGAPAEGLMHADRSPEIADLARRYSLAQISGIIGQIVETEQMLGDNLNVKIPAYILKEKIWARS
ncbi:MAG: DNA polymerase III subunit [Candidatus Omnitrophota bacterium]|nr:DNA polymerase III subunit [Candidatus Omnitrophota bacterium]MDZ4241819.1 DNA polymerase III subunit [Candidatus Omnitrophota bacterium]